MDQGMSHQLPIASCAPACVIRVGVGKMLHVRQIDGVVPFRVRKRNDTKSPSFTVTSRHSNYVYPHMFSCIILASGNRGGRAAGSHASADHLLQLRQTHRGTGGISGSN